MTFRQNNIQLNDTNHQITQAASKHDLVAAKLAMQAQVDTCQASVRAVQASLVSMKANKAPTNESSSTNPPAKQAAPKRGRRNSIGFFLDGYEDAPAVTSAVCNKHW